jgi:tRNA threonylcarbamoyladenosine biosynthesis protein TsaE
VKAVVEPRQQPRLGGAEVDAGNTDLGESELVSPLAQPPNERLTVDRLQHPPILGTRVLDWPDETACAACAAALARAPALADAFVALEGPLGAGKTTFVRHLLRTLGVEGRIKSPSYAVVETYAARGRAISHFDFYRFDDAREWADAGLRDLFAAPGLKLAEWPEKAAGALPPPDLTLAIEPVGDGDRRRVVASASTERGLALLTS